MSISIDPQLASLGCEIHLGALTYPVKGGASDDLILGAMQDACAQRREELMGEAAATDPTIAAVRAAFKLAGKDPSRYRPSSEALTRRAIAGDALPVVNAVVDIGNIVSLMTGVPVGVYDQSKLQGALTLRVGDEGETYTSLGRGDINLDGIILLADNTGPCGTPFSDSRRTGVTEDTKDVLFLLYGLNLDVEIVEAAAEFADTLMTQFAVDPDRMADSAPEVRS